LSVASREVERQEIMKRLRSSTPVAAALLVGTGAFAGEVEVVDSEASFPEGPLWHDGRLYYVEYGADTVMRWDGKASMQVWQQDGCGPSAVVETGDGNFLITCYDANTLVEITPAGDTVATLSEDREGQPLVGPNDAVLDAKGGVYFSASGVWDIAAPIDGRILYLAPDGAIAEVADDIHYANGLALSPDGRTLYASEMAAQRVLKFEVEGDGTLGERYLFVRLGDLAADPQGVDIYMGPDGLKTDSAGNLYIAQFEGGRVLVADPKGALVRILTVPAPYVTNLTFGETEDVVFVTAASDAWSEPYPGQVYKIDNR
jgi:gluconolactonase